MNMNIENSASKLLKVRVRVSSWMGSVKSDEGQTELAQNHGAEKDALRVGLSLLPKSVQKEIRDHVIGIRKAVDHVSIMFEKGGFRIMKAVEFSRLNAEVNKRRYAFLEYIHDEVYQKHGELVAMAAARLGSLFDESDFPSQDEILSKYNAKMVVQRVDNLKDFQIEGISDKEADELRKEALADFEANLKEGMMEVVGRLRKAVVEIQDKTKSEDSRYKRALENLAEMCDVVPTLNIIDNEALNNLAAEIKAKIAGQNSEAIKEDKKVAKKLAETAATFTEALDNLVF